MLFSIELLLELEIICKECILNTVRESMPVEKILRSYIDETTEEEIVEEEVIEPVTKEADSSGNMQDTISAEVQEEIKKAADAIKEKVNINKKESTDNTPKTEKQNIKLEISATIQDLEKKIETKKTEVTSDATTETSNTESPTLKVTTEPTETVKASEDNKATNISFNDTDSIVKYDTKARPSNTPEPETIVAPKTIERLEEISHVRN